MYFSCPSRLIAALAAATLFAASAVGADELAEAGKLLRSGKHELAMARVGAVLAQHPEDPRARFLQGLILADQGKSDAALEVFHKLTVDFPDLPEPHNNLAVIYASRGEYEKARMALEQSIRTHPSYATAYENLGDVYAKLASQAYDRALKLDSGNTGAQNKLALVRDLVGETRTAMTAPPARDVPPARAESAVAVAPTLAIVATREASPPSATPAGSPAAGSADVLAAVDTWAQAWSRQDVNAYLAAYAPDYRPGDGESREAWERTRRARVSAPKSVAVKVDGPRVRSTGEGTASVTFRQHYRSDRFKASSTKTLVLNRAADGRWQIVEERIGR